MKLNNVKRTMIGAAFSLIAILGTSEIANAQNRKQVQKQQQKAGESATETAKHALSRLPQRKLLPNGQSRSAIAQTSCKRGLSARFPRRTN